MRISDWSSDVCSSDLRIEIETAAIVLHLDVELRAFAPEVDADLAGRRLAAARASIRRLDAMHDRVAQQMFERRRPALPHIAIRSEARRVGKEVVSTCSSGWSRYH